METIRFKLTGVAPLLMNSDRFTNPLDPAAKAHKSLTSKRKKTDEDHMQIARSSFMGALYHDPELGPYVSGQAIEATILNAAKLQKLGTRVKRGLVVLEDKTPLHYDGPRDPEKLWSDLRFVDCRSVRVGTAKVMRYRPVFSTWSVEFSAAFNPEQLDQSDVMKSVEDTGLMIGLLDFRPRFGRFGCQVI